MFKKFRMLFAAIVAGGAVAGVSSAAEAAYIDPALNQIVSSGGGDIVVVFNSVSAGDTSELFSLDFGGAALFNNQTSPLGTMTNIGSFAAGEVLEFRLDNLSSGHSFFTGLASDNVDNVLHARLTDNGDGTITVGFEDLLNGGDFDYNDVVFTVYETPIPGAALLLLTGLAGFGVARRGKTDTAAV